jgi:two-component sensor histidine kinase
MCLTLLMCELACEAMATLKEPPGAGPLTDRQADEARLAELVQISAPGVWEWQPSARKFIASDRFLAILGLRAPPSFDAFLSRIDPDGAAWMRAIEPSSVLLPLPESVRFRIRRDDGEVRWVECRLSHSGSGQLLRIAGTVTDITEQEATAHALVESEERLKLAIEAGKMAVWEVDLETGHMTPSAELNVLCGFPPDATPNLSDVRALYDPGEIERLDREGATVEAVRSQAVGGAFEPWRKGALASGDNRTQIQAEVAVTTPAGVKKRLLLRAQYALSRAGRPLLTGVLLDITEAKLAEERLALVARELQHRVKNTISVVSAIAAQTLRDSAGTPEFLARLKALATATDLTIGRHTSVVRLSTLLAKIIQPYRGQGSDPFLISGEDADLQGKAATALGLVLHELCTNAVKYGALSLAGGHVEIHSTVSASVLQLTWAERNGPAVSAPSKRGFGTRLLEHALAGDIGGSAALDFAPTGLRCQISLRL